MTSKPVALLLAYRPAFPSRFASIEAARAHCQEFFPWYGPPATTGLPATAGRRHQPASATFP
jgi:hypothetical protein